VIANMIWAFNLESNYLDKEDPWKRVLTVTTFAVRSTYHTTLKKMPGQLVFGHDMIFNIQHVANWGLLDKIINDVLTKTSRLKMQNA
jgi:hypothetical protein